MEGSTIILMRIILRNVDEHDDNHLDNDIHNGDDDNYGNNNTSGGVRRACWSLSMVTLVLHGSNKFIADSSKYRSKTEKGNSVTHYVWSLIQVLTLQC